MIEKWSKEKAWEWYNAQLWITGFNGYPSNCVNRIAMWQEYGHDEVAKQLRYEFELAKKTGFNAVRTILQFDVWLYQHDSFLKHFEEYVSLADEFGIKIMLLVGNDCCVAKSRWKAPVFGEQKIDWGYHSGIKGGQHAGDYTEPGYQLLDEPQNLEKFYEMVDEFARIYAHDERIQVWNVWNEIGNSNRGMMSVECMKKCFEIIRSHDPIQPLTADVWRSGVVNGKLTPEEKIAVELSDVISFHCYKPFPEFVLTVERLKNDYGRPLLCTEWLNRIEHNDVADVYPLLYLERIGSFPWGLIAGYSQTYEPWGCYFFDLANPKFDVTKWQHDLYRFNGHPYDPAEIELIKKFNRIAKTNEVD